MTERVDPSPAERSRTTRLCARLGVQPTAFTPEQWLEMAIEAEGKNMPQTYPSADYMEIAAIAERFPGRTFY